MTRDVLIDGYTLFVGHPEQSGVDPGDDGGLYHRDTRHLSALSVSIGDGDLDLVGRDLTGPNHRRVVTTEENNDVNRVDDPAEKRSDVVVETSQTVVEDEGLIHELTVVNHSAVTFNEAVSIAFEVDFADVFEVRGFASELERDPRVEIGESDLTYTYGYETSNGAPVTRRTTISFDREPVTLGPTGATFDVELGPQEITTFTVHVRPDVSDQGTSADGGTSPHATGSHTESEETDRPVIPTVSTGNGAYDRVFARAAEDLTALTAETPYGPVPLAGAPWFATVFGRDSLIAAYQVVHLEPAIARGTLRYLAAHQGRDVDDATEEAPGKIFHEIREGELARRGRVPHSPYYGSVDATPLWIVLLAELHRWTGDDGIVDELESALEGALSWIDRTRQRYGDDPFVYYDESPTMGLLHKAWRDTPGSVQSPDGEVAEPPIASVEVQGYVHRALLDAADLYEHVLEDGSRATDLRAQAARLAEAFESTFWLPEKGFYGVAKDGTGATVPTATSNVGHCLWSGIVPESKAEAVVDGLTSPDLFSGWGVRTMATSVAGYSPISYHLGSVWPHDTSVTALGMARYGYHVEANRLTSAILDAATHFDDHRIPELFCGFDDEYSPKPYASSCVPQAWSAGAPFALLRASFDVEPGQNGIDVGYENGVLPRDALKTVRRRWSP